MLELVLELALVLALVLAVIAVVAELLPIAALALYTFWILLVAHPMKFGLTAGLHTSSFSRILPMC